MKHNYVSCLTISASVWPNPCRTRRIQKKSPCSGKTLLTRHPHTTLTTNHSSFHSPELNGLMKAEEDVKMIAAEVPVLFSLITEIFIQELTVRAWMSTEDGRRKILQSNDINFAVKTSSMYDFLTYIVPGESYMKGKDEYSADNLYPFQEEQIYNERSSRDYQ